MSKPVILTGLRANNELHIGNYFGALLPIVDIAKNRSSEYQINLFVPDLHSITTPIDHSKLQRQIMDTLRTFVAAGLPLDNPNVHIYRQSYIHAHSELAWILDCFTGYGEMKRMTQFKDKSKRQMLNSAGDLSSEEVNLTIEGSTSVGVFNYPVLMAADILLYKAKYIPVGDDQTQHIEFARNIAERINRRFNEPLFLIPETVINQHKFFGKEHGLRIKDLVDPLKKMSKSEESDKGVIFLSDNPEEAAIKILKATTDNLKSIKKSENQPGMSNLIEIYSLINGQSADDFNNSPWVGSPEYQQFKNLVANTVTRFLKEFQKNLNEVDNKKINEKLAESEAEMNKVANNTLAKVQKAVGLR